MNIHLLKEEPEYFREVVRGGKTCEIRKNDRDFQVGDTLILAPYKNGTFLVGVYITTITYIDDYPDGLKAGYVVLSFDKKNGTEVAI